MALKLIVAAIALVIVGVVLVLRGKDLPAQITTSQKLGAWMLIGGIALAIVSFFVWVF